jgi:hypothetical protein
VGLGLMCTGPAFRSLTTVAFSSTGPLANGVLVVARDRGCRRAAGVLFGIALAIVGCPSVGWAQAPLPARVDVPQFSDGPVAGLSTYVHDLGLLRREIDELFPDLPSMHSIQPPLIPGHGRSRVLVACTADVAPHPGDEVVAVLGFRDAAITFGGCLTDLEVVVLAHNSGSILGTSKLHQSVADEVDLIAIPAAGGRPAQLFVRAGWNGKWTMAWLLRCPEGDGLSEELEQTVAIDMCSGVELADVDGDAKVDFLRTRKIGREGGLANAELVNWTEVLILTDEGQLVDRTPSFPKHGGADPDELRRALSIERDRYGGHNDPELCYAQGLAYEWSNQPDAALPWYALARRNTDRLDPLMRHRLGTKIGERVAQIRWGGASVATDDLAANTRAAYEAVRDLPIESLIELTDDRNWLTRQTAVWALAESGAESAVGPLIRALRDDHEFVRRSAAWALGVLGDPSAVSSLSAALRDERAAVRWRSSEALQRIDNNLQQAQQNEGGHIDPAVTCRPISESELTQILSVVEADEGLGYHGGIWFLETCYVAQEWAELSAGVFQADGFRAILRHIGGNWSLVDYGSDVWPSEYGAPLSVQEALSDGNLDWTASAEEFMEPVAPRDGQRGTESHDGAVRVNTPVEGEYAGPGVQFSAQAPPGAMVVVYFEVYGYRTGEWIRRMAGKRARADEHGLVEFSLPIPRVARGTPVTLRYELHVAVAYEDGTSGPETIVSVIAEP